MWKWKAPSTLRTVGATLYCHWLWPRKPAAWPATRSPWSTTRRQRNRDRGTSMCTRSPTCGQVNKPDFSVFSFNWPRFCRKQTAERWYARIGGAACGWGDQHQGDCAATRTSQPPQLAVQLKSLLQCHKCTNLMLLLLYKIYVFMEAI